MMRSAKRIVSIIALSMLAITIAGCGTNRTSGSTSSIEPDVEVGRVMNQKGCENSKIDWIDMVMLNDIKYESIQSVDVTVPDDQLGAKIDETEYMIMDNACSDYITRNGDSTRYPIGTPIYEMKGYDHSFRIVVNNRIYQAEQNTNAATIAELLDIEDKVKHVSFESLEDGSVIHEFDPEAAQSFIDELLTLHHVDYKEIQKVEQKSSSGETVFIRITLKDDTYFRIVYDLGSNILHPEAIGTVKLKGIVQSQLDV